MKRLWLLRHASAESFSPDSQRRLTSGGEDEARRVGTHWADASHTPELVLCSPARRARATAEIVTAPLAPAPPRQLDETLYLASPGSILRAIGTVAPSCAALLVVGHNPGLADLAGDLAIGGGAAARELRTAGFPPATLATFDLDINDWTEVDAALAELVTFRTP